MSNFFDPIWGMTTPPTATTGAEDPFFAPIVRKARNPKPTPVPSSQMATVPAPTPAPLQTSKPEPAPAYHMSEPARLAALVQEKMGEPMTDEPERRIHWRGANDSRSATPLRQRA